MSDPSSVLYVVLLVGVVLFAFVVAPKLDHDRIRENIESHGGKVIEILRAWGSGGRNDRAYEVSYMTATGQRKKATCRTNMWRGVYWVNTRPPGLDSDEPDDVPLRGYVAEEPPGPTEPIPCLRCGSMIPEDKVCCPQCGWSYRAYRAGR